jgi:outer membrane protein assembly factor BamE (lipoprotein component of BamABCDE complex)
MSRRRLTYAVLVVASFVVSACSQPTAPVRDDTIVCRGAVIIGNGVTCTPE